MSSTEMMLGVEKFTKNQRIERYALRMLRLWKNLIDESKGDQFYKLHERQCYHDALIQMVDSGLIAKYDVVNIKVKLAKFID
jgi:hypothetical protein